MSKDLFKKPFNTFDVTTSTTTTTTTALIKIIPIRKRVDRIDPSTILEKGRMVYGEDINGLIISIKSGDGVTQYSDLQELFKQIKTGEFAHLDKSLQIYDLDEITRDYNDPQYQFDLNSYSSFNNPYINILSSDTNYVVSPFDGRLWVPGILNESNNGYCVDNFLSGFNLSTGIADSFRLLLNDGVICASGSNFNINENNDYISCIAYDEYIEYHTWTIPNGSNNQIYHYIVKKDLTQNQTYNSSPPNYNIVSPSFQETGYTYHQLTFPQNTSVSSFTLVKDTNGYYLFITTSVIYVFDNNYNYVSSITDSDKISNLTLNIKGFRLQILSDGNTYLAGINQNSLSFYDIPSDTFNIFRPLSCFDVIHGTASAYNSPHNECAVFDDYLYFIANNTLSGAWELIRYNLTNDYYDSTFLSFDDTYTIKGHFVKDPNNILSITSPSNVIKNSSTKNGLILKNLSSILIADDTGNGFGSSDIRSKTDFQTWIIDENVNDVITPDIANLVRKEITDSFRSTSNGFYNIGNYVRLPSVAYFQLIRAQVNTLTTSVTYRDNGDFVQFTPVRNTGAFGMTESTYFDGNSQVSYIPAQYHVIVDKDNLEFPSNQIDHNSPPALYMVPGFINSTETSKYYRQDGVQIDSTAVVEVTYINHNPWFDIKPNSYNFPDLGLITSTKLVSGPFAETIFPMDLLSGYNSNMCVRKYLPDFNNVTITDITGQTIIGTSSSLITSGVGNKGDIGCINTAGHGPFTNGGLCLFLILEDNVNVSTLPINNSALAGEFSHINDSRVLMFAYQDEWYSQLVFNANYYGLFELTSYVFADRIVTVGIDESRYTNIPMFYGMGVTKYSASNHKFALSTDPQNVLFEADNIDNVSFMFGLVTIDDASIAAQYENKMYFDLQVLGTDPSKINAFNGKFFFNPGLPLIGQMIIHKLSGSLQFFALVSGASVPFSDPGVTYGWKVNIEVDELIGQNSILAFKIDDSGTPMQFGTVTNSSFYAELSNPQTNTGYFSPSNLIGKINMDTQCLDNLKLLPYLNTPTEQYHTLTILKTPQGIQKGLYINDNGNIKVGDLTDDIDNS